MSTKMDPILKDALSPSTPERLQQERDAAWKELKRVWAVVENIEREVQALRMALPGDKTGDDWRTKLQTLHAMCGIALVKKRKVGRELHSALLEACGGSFEVSEGEEE